MGSRADLDIGDLKSDYLLAWRHSSLTRHGDGACPVDAYMLKSAHIT